MISILLAAGVALAVALLGTPVAIHAFSSWGWGQRIREDGPHTHLEKMGTPTMGGIVDPDRVRRSATSRRGSRRSGSRPTGLALVLVAVGFGVVGFLDDYAKVKRRRSLGLTKLQKFVGTAIVSLALRVARDALRGDDAGHLAPTSRSCGRPRSRSAASSSCGRSSC